MTGNFRIGPWLVQPSAGQLCSGDSDNNQSVYIEPKAMSVLVILSTAGGEVVSRQEIMDAVWPNQDVTDDVLTSSISSLRKALGDDSRAARYIQTLPKRGYRMVAPVQWISEEESPSSSLTPGFVPAEAPTHENRKRRWWAAGLLGAVILAVFLLLRSQAPVPLLPDERSIAVLPFDVFSNQVDMEHFASGLEEELIHQLASDPGLKVIARSSSSQFQGKAVGIHEIARILQVRHVIEGSVRDSSSGIRITVQLIDTESEHHLWSQVFDVERDHLVDVQERVGRAVSELMHSDGDATPLVQMKSRHPVPEEAYRLFLLGESHMRVGTAEAYRKAVDYFSDALRISPAYALAYTRLAAAWLLLYQYDHQPLDLVSERAHSALNKALQLDPRQPEALAVMGLLYTYQKNYEEAEPFFLQAIERQPNLRFALHNYGFMLWNESRFDESLVYLRRALQLDPLSGVTNFLIGDSLVGIRAFEQARQHYLQCQTVLPEYYSCYAGLATLEQLEGDLIAATDSLQRAGKLVPQDYLWQEIGLAGLALHKGDIDQAEELLASASGKAPLNYNILKLRLLVNLFKGRLPEFMTYLQQLRETNPLDRDLNLVIALAYFYASECEAAVDIYQQELENSDAFLNDVWDLESGFSHATNLAFCYGQLGQSENQAWVLSTVDRFLEREPASEFVGDTWLRSHYLALNGNDSAADELLQQLQNSDWPLAWLAGKDPVHRAAESR